MSRPVARYLFPAFGVVVVIITFLWGDYLLGLDCGMVYAAIALALLCLVARSRTPAGHWSPVQLGIITALSVTVGYAMAYPASFAPSLQGFIYQQATDRAVRSELAMVFASDPAYRDFSVSSKRSKLLSVTIRGSLETRAGFNRLRSRVVGECPALRECFLTWDATFRDSGQRVNLQDQDGLFHNAEPDAPPDRSGK